LKLRNLDFLLWYGVFTLIIYVATWNSFASSDTPTDIIEFSLEFSAIVTTIFYGLFRLNLWWFHRVSDEYLMRRVFILLWVFFGSLLLLTALMTTGLIGDLVVQIVILGMSIIFVIAFRGFIAEHNPFR
jgi:hypothetical protein